jgi:hypothetical protein
MNNPINTTPIETIDKKIMVQQKLADILADETSAELEPDTEVEIPTEAVSPMKQEKKDEEKKEEEKEESEINEKENPTIYILGKHIDRDSFIVHMIIIAIWIFIWHMTNLLRAVWKDAIFTTVFLSFIIYNLASIATAGTSSGGVVYELNILLTVEQMVSILFGTIVLFALFHKNIPSTKCEQIVTSICVYNIIILTISSLWVSVWTSGRAFRSIRKFKQGIYNIALSLFILIGVIYLKSFNLNDMSCLNK